MELWSHKSYFVSIKLNGSPVFNGHSISTCIVVRRCIGNGNEAMQRKRDERKRIVKKGSGAGQVKRKERRFELDSINYKRGKQNPIWCFCLAHDIVKATAMSGLHSAQCIMLNRLSFLPCIYSSRSTNKRQ